MPPPLLYYIRHGETDWNVEGRLQGQRDIPINARGRAQARRCGEILRDLLARDAIDPGQLDFVVEPARARARDDGDCCALRPGSTRPPTGWTRAFPKSRSDAGKGSRSSELRQRWPDAVDERERDKWGFVPPEAESYATMSVRIRDWYDALTRDTVAVAHGGTLRGLVVQLGIAPPEEAPFLDIAQGVVYVIRPGSMSRYA